jgi:uncharacterized protein with PQ loop repeat
MNSISLIAGTIAAGVFTLSHIPMLVRAAQTKDLRSYSRTNLILTNIGNLCYWLYVANLPFGPIWFLHSFYTVVAAMMLFWYQRYRHAV